MAQTRKTFFDLGAAERIADPWEEEAARRRALEIQEAQRQDSLRAAIAGENLQRQQLAQAQQKGMASMGMDRQRLALDRERMEQEMLLARDRMAASQAEAGLGRAHGLKLNELTEAGVGKRWAGTDATRRKLSEDSLAQALALAEAETKRLGDAEKARNTYRTDTLKMKKDAQAETSRANKAAELARDLEVVRPLLKRIEAGEEVSPFEMQLLSTSQQDLVVKARQKRSQLRKGDPQTPEAYFGLGDENKSFWDMFRNPNSIQKKRTPLPGGGSPFGGDPDALLRKLNEQKREASRTRAARGLPPKNSDIDVLRLERLLQRARQNPDDPEALADLKRALGNAKRRAGK